jgi:hypothetical protein
MQNTEGLKGITDDMEGQSDIGHHHTSQQQQQQQHLIALQSMYPSSQYSNANMVPLNSRYNC